MSKMLFGLPRRIQRSGADLYLVLSAARAAGQRME
jgi:hypothetical protein